MTCAECGQKVETFYYDFYEQFPKLLPCGHWSRVILKAGKQ